MTTRAGIVGHGVGHWRSGPDAVPTQWQYAGEGDNPSLGGTVTGMFRWSFDAAGDTEIDFELDAVSLGTAIIRLPELYWPASTRPRAVVSGGTMLSVTLSAIDGAVTFGTIAGGSGGGGGTSSVVLTAGSGLTGGGTLDANRTIDWNPDNSTLEVSSDTARVKADGILVSHIGDAELKALGGVTAAADKLPYFTSGTAAAVTDFSSFARTFVDDTTAGTARATLGVIASLFQSGGSQVIALDTLGVPTDITTLNASTSWHGLLRKLDNDTSHFLRGDGAWAAPAGGTASGNPADVQTFNAGTSQTWTKPSGSPQRVRVICIGPGGGGAGGASSVNTAKGGGCGGGGGGVVIVEFAAGDLGSSVNVDVGTGGTGGAGGAAGAGAAGTDGNNASGPTTFGSHVSAYAGGGGRGGTNANAAGGAGASVGASANKSIASSPSSSGSPVGGQAAAGVSAGNGLPSEWGGASGGGSTTGLALDGGSSVYAGPGGGSGGRVSATNVGSNGGDGGTTGSYSTAGGVAGGAGGATPATPSAGSFTGPYCGEGGGGGGAGSAVPGANGGDASVGAGGGGGGAGSNSSSGSNAGGTGGNGGDGRCIVITTY